MADSEQTEMGLAETPESAAPLAEEAGPLKDMIDANFMQYASYVICARAIPDVADGLKPVQRRILHALKEMDDGRFTKVANVVGHTMQYHPHGDASIGDALVNLVNKRYLIEGQGNFGNLYTGDVAAAPRYIECRLTELARDELFNTKLTRLVPSYDGRRNEPVTLPSKLPLLLMLGAEGIAVGLATRILPHNFIELLQAQIAVLKKEPFLVLPDFIQGGIMDAGGYDDGRGSVRVRARLEEGDSDKLIIRELPFGTTTESLMATIEDAARRKRVPIKSISDFTSESVEIELTLAPDSDPVKTIQKLYAFTACEVSLSSNITVIRDGRPCTMTVSEVVKANTRYLLKVLKRELTHRRGELSDAIHARTLTRIFIEERLYKKIESCRSQEAVYEAVFAGLKPYRKELPREVTKKDVDTLLALQIRRISLFDISKNKKEIETLQGDLEKVERALANITGHAVRTLQGLIRKYEETYPRRTETASFSEVKVKELTATELDIGYDKKTGYLGYQVKGTSLLPCSSFDKLLLVWRDGTYKVMPPPEKVFVDKHLLYCASFDRKRVFTVIYTNLGFTYIKRFSCGGTIMNRDYTCTLPESKVLLFREGTPDVVYLKYKPAKGQRIHQQRFTPSDTPVKGAKARGNQMTSKVIEKLTTRTPSWWDKKDKTPGGVLT